MGTIESWFHTQFAQLTHELGQGWAIEVGCIIAVTLLATLVWRIIGKRIVKLAERSQTHWDNILWESLNGPVSWFILLLGLSLVADSVADRIDSNLAQYLPVIRKVCLEVLFALAAWRVTNSGEDEFIAKGRDATTVQAVAKLLKASIIIIVLLTVFQSLGVSISGLLAFGGVGGLVIGMAAKDLLANFFGAFVIYLDKPFRVGDWIRSPDRAIEGTVERIGFRVTKIRTFDQRPLYVPNSVFTQVSVENPSRMLNRRIYETIGVRYQDAEQVSTIVEQVKAMLQSHEAIDTNKTLMVNFNGFGASSLDFFIYTFTKTVDWKEYHQIKQDVLLKTLAIIHQNGADCAFPTQTLHIESLPQPEPEA
ncbi:mechanosensitive ion channel family protein [Celerinatantimonas sp. MCCC 1A17872]|uniref:mechanosensitive ion channel family protein n=1 Tax=Celerinatantimonas sp. MCCC 1A17872 TaxID=3177514 RepID=UPI0038C59061